MKRHGGLWGKLTSFENLLLAARKAQRGKRFNDATARFNFRLEPELFRLQDELVARTYRPGPYRSFAICEPKVRLISAAPYRDRVVHHALCNLIEPIFDRTFIHDSYACRRGKGTHRAVDRLTEFARRSRYVLKCDVRKFFPSVDHEVVKEAIRRRIKCPDTLWLIDLIIDRSNPQEPAAFYFSGDDLFTPHERRRGLPIGNLTSQFFANVYLNGFDHWMKQEVGARWYIRYVDDFLVLGDDKGWLRDVLARSRERLASLRLKLHERKCRVFPVSCGTEFLGYRVFPDHRQLRRENLDVLRRRMRRLQQEYTDGLIGVERVRESIRSWIAHASHADTWGLRRDVLRRYAFVRGQVGKPVPRCSGRLLEQQSQELPRGLSEQGRTDEHELQQRVSCGRVPEDSATPESGQGIGRSVRAREVQTCSWPSGPKTQ